MFVGMNSNKRRYLLIAIDKEMLHTPFSPFAPVVEPKGTVNAFITEHPYEITLKGKLADVPMLSSVTLDEGLYPGAMYYAKKSRLDEINDKWQQLAPHLFDFNDTVPASRHSTVANKIREYYVKNQKITRQNLMGFVQALSDRHFVNDVEKCSRLAAKSAKHPSYFYLFKYNGATSLGQYLGGENIGVSHGDDTGYMITTEYMNASANESDRRMIKTMVKMIVGFARTGTPDVDSVKWTPLDRSDGAFNYLEINDHDDLKMITADTLGSAKFWDTLEIVENERVVGVKDEL